jgi:hypothetical protein
MVLDHTAPPLVIDSVKYQDIDDRVVNFSRDLLIEAANGGTFDVIPVLNGAALGVAGSAALSSVAVTSYTAVKGQVVEVVSANTMGTSWIKTGDGYSCTVYAYYDGTNAFTSPTFTVSIPSGVPSGELRVTTKVGSLISYGVQVMSGGGTSLSDVSGMQTTGLAMSLSDGTRTYVTYASGSGNDAMTGSRRIEKTTTVATTLTFTMTLTGSGASAAYAAYNVVFAYTPSQVKLGDIPDLTVDVAHNTKLYDNINLIAQYNQYCSEQGWMTPIGILNQRLGTSYTVDMLYPINWNAGTLGVSTITFINTFCVVMNEINNLMAADLNFLK